MIALKNKKWTLLIVFMVQSVLYSQKTKVLYDVFSISGKVIDSKTNDKISNADLYLLNCNKSVVANSEGNFQFNISKGSFNDKLIISALGYSSDTIMVSELEKRQSESLQIKLNKEKDVEVLLNETVVVSSKKKSKTLSALAILKKAKENIEKNYYQKPFNQKFFFRAQTNKDNVFTINEEASIDTYSPNGIKVSEDAAANYYGEILQFRKKVDSETIENWKGIGYFGVVIFRNIMLSNQNLLYETKDFELKKEGTTTYCGKKVYVISFTNVNPTIFSTGFGNPAPQSAIGFIYIETDSFAIVKFEQYVVLNRNRSNDNDDIVIESSLKMTQTYKNVNGRYFINYCNEKVESNYFSVSDKKLVSSENSDYDLMSEDIITEKVSVIKRPIDRLKLDPKFVEDLEYWKNNNFIIENKKMEF
ncbi:carboxypeptidase-like protein [Flavobacterium sp. 90]|uniref:carboxypeptidase-like regulatory domain-containing protein n=1 Tax=unclassified Flavobacterium TaxID=196869 RepID=UPI000EAED7AC|nr:MULTISPECIES: carboxypeptidase-like regulatory domain-containing protein [unclassified Flavobacterium]RKR09913.1 carboxypeptidase-like protein [Flavobacterium sp. 81]TCK53698.1 carboxypeptidase-like protein [Flavobacterium sp. 90]